MAPTYDQRPGTLNLAFNRGDDFQTVVDFSIPMLSHAVSALITSLVTGDEVAQFTVEFQSAADGQVKLSLTDTQTASLPRGTYGWVLRWTDDNATRTALAGVVEVL